MKQVLIFRPLAERNVCNITFVKQIFVQLHDAFSACQVVFQVIYVVAESYMLVHFKESAFDDEKLLCEVYYGNHYPNFVCVQFQSRYSRSKTYNTMVRFDSQEEKSSQACYCICVSESRQLSRCTHTATLPWNLGVNQAHIPDLQPLIYWDSLRTIIIMTAITNLTTTIFSTQWKLTSINKMYCKEITF